MSKILETEQRRLNIIGNVEIRNVYKTLVEQWGVTVAVKRTAKKFEISEGDLHYARKFW